MFKLLTKLGLDKYADSRTSAPAAQAEKTAEIRLVFGNAKDAKAALVPDSPIYLRLLNESALLTDVLFLHDRKVFSVHDAAPLVEDLLRVILAGTYPLYAADSKALWRYAFSHEITMAPPVFDFSLAAYLLNPNAASYSIKETALAYSVPLPAFPESEGSETDPMLLSETACLEVLHKRLSGNLEANEQTALLTGIEMPLAKVLASMELAGMEVSRKQIEDYSVVLSKEIDTLQQEIYDLAGETFNIQSPKQLGVILFEKLGLPGKKKTKTGYSTNADVLEDLRYDYPIVEKILSYRAYAKLKSTYCEGLLKAIAEDGRIHSTFNQTETRTGRLSSTEPNLQNIPVRTELGREFRKFFVAKNGCDIVDADYSQIELRVLAALSDDQTMIDCFNEGIDIHTSTAAKVFGIPEENVTSELRSRAKAVNFGIVYGIGAFSLAKDIHVTRAEAEKFIKAYLALYSSVDAYMEHSIQEAKEKGYAVTLFNRRRYLPELSSSNHMLRSFGERVARNMPIQGTAADIIKIAMVKVFKDLEGLKSRLILQVHDELIIETAAGEEAQVEKLLKDCMENAVKLSVDLVADLGRGASWYDLK